MTLNAIHCKSDSIILKKCKFVEQFLSTEQKTRQSRGTGQIKKLRYCLLYISVLCLQLN